MEFIKGKQKAWFHLARDNLGIFHTYDNFQPSSVFPSRKVHVFLPSDYEETSNNYKVAYMNDGNCIFWPGGAYNKTWDLLTVLQDLYSKNSIEKIIFVAIEPLDRETEYTHEKVFIQNKVGNVDEYANYLASVVKPFLDDNYRTIKSAENTAIIGSSHGGLAAFYIATRRPKSFGIAICLSPSFWVGVDSSFSIYALQMPFLTSLVSSKLIQPILNTLKDPEIRPKIYVDYGLVRLGGFHNYIIEALATRRSKELVDLLLELGYNMNKDLFECEDKEGVHEEESWHKRMYKILPLFYGFDK